MNAIHERLIRRVNSALPIILLLMFGWWLGFEIVRGCQLGNPAFRMVAGWMQ